MATGIVQDVLAPKELILPDRSGAQANQPQVIGSIYLSGAKLYFYNGSTKEIITSA